MTIGGSGKRIVVVDDDEDSREALALLLRDHGYEVTGYADGATALEGLRGSPAPHLIILDLRMPTMDGWQFRVLQKAEPHLARIPVIALSAERSSQARAIDVDEFLEKPTHYDKLIATVQAVLERAAARVRRENQLALESLAVVGRFSTGIAHEINNPLSSVTTNLHVLRDELARLAETLSGRGGSLPSPEALRGIFVELDAMVADSLEGSERIRAIVKDLHVFTRVDDAGDRPITVEDALDSAVHVARNVGLGHPSIERCYAGPTHVLTTESRLVQLFVNLLGNAFQALVAGRVGRVTVETFRDGDGANVVVRVRDNGAGIAPEIRGRIFEPFFTTRPVGQAVGLGLSVCLGIVTALGGSIDVASEVGAGSTFTVTLPAYVAKPTVEL